MKKLSLLLVVVCLLLGTGNAFATCHPSAYGPYTIGSLSYYLYDQPQNCYSLTSGVSNDVVGCNYVNGWSFSGAYLMNASTTFTLTSSDPIINSNKWLVGSNIEFNSPAADAYNWVQLAVYVYHPNNTVSQYSIFYWDGRDGTLSGCPERSGYFSADVGDTVTIQINALNTAGGTIRASTPTLFNTN